MHIGLLISYSNIRTTRSLSQDFFRWYFTIVHHNISSFGIKLVSADRAVKLTPKASPHIERFIDSAINLFMTTLIFFNRILSILQFMWVPDIAIMALCHFTLPLELNDLFYRKAKRKIADRLKSS